jgi:hypothetical protein
MIHTRQIETQNWSTFLASFSDGNRGRAMGIEIFGLSLGDQSVVQSAPLLDVSFDPEEHGTGIVISTGEEAEDYVHIVEGPTEVWEATEDNGVSNALEIVDRGGVKTILLFMS